MRLWSVSETPGRALKRRESSERQLADWRESRSIPSAMKYPGYRHRVAVGLASHVSTSSRLVLLSAVTLIMAAFTACAARSAADMSAAEKKAIADSLKHLVVNTYDLSKPEAVQRLMSLYPSEGRVISASGGVTTTTRPKLQQAIQAFWTYVGQNMRNPKWEWTSMTVDVLAPDAAVMTSTYRIPHLTPMGTNHVIGGAWTAVFQKRGGRWVIIQEHLSDVQSNLNLQMNEMDMSPQTHQMDTARRANP